MEAQAIYAKHPEFEFPETRGRNAMTPETLKELVATMTPESYTPNQKEFVQAIAVLAFETGLVEGRQTIGHVWHEPALATTSGVEA